MEVIVKKNGKDKTTGKQAYAVEVEVRGNIRVGIHANLDARAAFAVKRNLDTLLIEIGRNV